MCIWSPTNDFNNFKNYYFNDYLVNIYCTQHIHNHILIISWWFIYISIPAGTKRKKKKYQQIVNSSNIEKRSNTVRYNNNTIAIIGPEQPSKKKSIFCISKFERILYNLYNLLQCNLKIKHKNIYMIVLNVMRQQSLKANRFIQHSTYSDK